MKKTCEGRNCFVINPYELTVWTISYFQIASLFSCLHDMGVGRIREALHYHNNQWLWSGAHIFNCFYRWSSFRGVPIITLIRENTWTYSFLAILVISFGSLLTSFFFFLLYQVTASSWLNDLRDQVERNKILNVIYRSATAVGSRLPSISNAKARVAGAGALLRPVSSSTQVCFIIFDPLLFRTWK